MQNVLIGLPPVPVEATRLAAWAAWYRSELKSPGRFVLLYVVPVPGQDLAGMMAESVSLAAQEGEALVARVRAQLAEAGEGFEVLIEAGDPGEVLCREAQAFDLLVVASHHRARLREMFVGSTENYVAQHAPCAVTLLCAKALERFGS